MALPPLLFPLRELPPQLLGLPLVPGFGLYLVGVRYLRPRRLGEQSSLTVRLSQLWVLREGPAEIVHAPPSPRWHEFLTFDASIVNQVKHMSKSKGHDAQTSPVQNTSFEP